MSLTTYQLLKFLHVVGFLAWIGSLGFLLRLLAVHARMAPADPLKPVERGVAIIMDIGATLVIGSGLYAALSTSPTMFNGNGWLHLKLTLAVVVLLAAHGLTRVKVRKFRDGDTVPPPAFLLPLVVVASIAIIALAVFKPFMY